mmetsp:Transcript_22735/g.76357  ORF Transcript_22735/g.76357 Transcript_22735/m.76357 type:complete len:328 (-) Transcript_22735:2020-3003(-)
MCCMIGQTARAPCAWTKRWGTSCRGSRRRSTTSPCCRPPPRAGAQRTLRLTTWRRLRLLVCPWRRRRRAAASWRAAAREQARRRALATTDQRGLPLCWTSYACGTGSWPAPCSRSRSCAARPAAGGGGGGTSAGPSMRTSRPLTTRRWPRTHQTRRRAWRTPSPRGNPPRRRRRPRPSSAARSLLGSWTPTPKPRHRSPRPRARRGRARGSRSRTARRRRPRAPSSRCSRSSTCTDLGPWIRAATVTVFPRLPSASRALAPSIGACLFKCSRFVFVCVSTRSLALRCPAATGPRTGRTRWLPGTRDRTVPSALSAIPDRDSPVAHES